MLVRSVSADTVRLDFVGPDRHQRYFASGHAGASDTIARNFEHPGLATSLASSANGRARAGCIAGTYRHIILISTGSLLLQRRPRRARRRHDRAACRHDPHSDNQSLVPSTFARLGGDVVTPVLAAST